MCTEDFFSLFCRDYCTPQNMANANKLLNFDLNETECEAVGKLKRKSVSSLALVFSGSTRQFTIGVSALDS